MLYTSFWRSKKKSSLRLQRCDNNTHQKTHTHFQRLNFTFHFSPNQIERQHYYYIHKRVAIFSCAFSSLRIYSIVCARFSRCCLLLSSYRPALYYAWSRCPICGGHISSSFGLHSCLSSHYYIHSFQHATYFRCAGFFCFDWVKSFYASKLPEVFQSKLRGVWHCVPLRRIVNWVGEIWNHTQRLS